MSVVPFSQRLGFEQSSSILEDFPASAKIALAHLLETMRAKKYLIGDYEVSLELSRTGRFFEPEVFSDDRYGNFAQYVDCCLEKMSWKQVYVFCERVYDRLLTPVIDTIQHGPNQYDYQEVERVSLDKVREFYVSEMNYILSEENIGYEFVDGQFQVRGRAQTQQSIQRVGKVLAIPALAGVLGHYNKALAFFRQFPDPDVENCVKEALCALEACVTTLGKGSQDFTKTIKSLEGNEKGKIPHPIAEGMIKLFGYRGSGQGVAHAALGGSRVSEVDAELVLSLTASYITYLVDLLYEFEEEIPF